MPAVAIVTLVAVGLLVAALAAYLVRVALILRHVVGRLEAILDAVAEVVEESAPIDDVVDAINNDLDAVRDTLEQAASRSRARAGVRDDPGEPSEGVSR